MLREVADAHGIPFLDATPDFRAADDPESLYL
jgi:hypothetical protein